jgi:hypothetical protein
LPSSNSTILEIHKRRVLRDLQKPGFDNAFGDAFQWYVGQVIERGTQRESTRFYSEAQYRVGKDSKRTVDWIVQQDGAAIFVEAKTKRLAHQAKVEIIEGDILPLELDKLAAMVVQAYKSTAYRAFLILKTGRCVRRRLPSPCRSPDTIASWLSSSVVSAPD